MKSASGLFRAAIIVLFIVVIVSACMPMMTVVKAQDSPGMNSISGRVYDANHNAIPGAKVTLYYTKFLLEYKPAGQVKIANNPQFTSDGSKSLTGLYLFSGLSSEVYIVTVEKDGIAYSENVQVIEGTKTVDLTIPGYIEKNYTASPTLTPRPSPTYTNVIPTGLVPTSDLGSIISDVARLLLMCLVGLQFVAGIAIVALNIGRKK
jgi:hypothetical protein